MNGLMDCAEDIGASQFIVDLGRRIAVGIDKLQQKKEPKPRDNHKPKVGGNIDKKA